MIHERSSLSDKTGEFPNFGDSPILPRHISRNLVYQTYLLIIKLIISPKTIMKQWAHRAIFVNPDDGIAN